MFATHMKKKNWFADTAAYLIFDDTVINKKYGHDIELTWRQSDMIWLTTITFRHDIRKKKDKGPVSI